MQREPSAVRRVAGGKVACVRACLPLLSLLLSLLLLSGWGPEFFRLNCRRMSTVRRTALRALQPRCYARYTWFSLGKYLLPLLKPILPLGDPFIFAFVRSLDQSVSAPILSRRGVRRACSRGVILCPFFYRFFYRSSPQTHPPYDMSSKDNTPRWTNFSADFLPWQGGHTAVIYRDTGTHRNH